jgi:hypothetical protein
MLFIEQVLCLLGSWSTSRFFLSPFYRALVSPSFSIMLLVTLINSHFVPQIINLDVTLESCILVCSYYY